MSDFDLVIVNGTVVDGTGSSGRRADVGVRDGRIVEIGRISDRRGRTIDADGHVVAPGFIDGHTHMDAQVLWDGLGASSCWQGVTTVVMGNCGFTLAPVQPARPDLVVQNLERAEDISAAALDAGIEWRWETFGEYLDALDGVDKGINYAGYIGHSALRTWAMGERAFEESATDADLDTMARQLEEALDAGAIGLSTSRSTAHMTPDDRPVASRLATWSEFERLAQVVGATGGIVELALEPDARSTDAAERTAHHDRLRRLALDSGVALTFGILPGPTNLAATEDLLSLIERTRSEGGRMFGQSHSRGISVLCSFRTRLFFDRLPAWRELRAMPLERQAWALQDPDLRRRLCDAADAGPYVDGVGTETRSPDFRTITMFDRPLGRNPTVAEVAGSLGVHPVEAMIQRALGTGMDQFFAQPISGMDPDAILATMLLPGTPMTFSDSGAHVSQIMDSSIQTHLLAHWVREEKALELEEAVRLITSVPAEAWGFEDRGVVREGFAADLVLFDPATVAPEMPRVVADVPGGAIRLEQRARGILATVVGGEVLVQEAEHTGAYPGKLLRRQAQPAIS